MKFAFERESRQLLKAHSSFSEAAGPVVYRNDVVDIQLQLRDFVKGSIYDPWSLSGDYDATVDCQLVSMDDPTSPVILGSVQMSDGTTSGAEQTVWQGDNRLNYWEGQLDLTGANFDTLFSATDEVSKTGYITFKVVTAAGETLVYQTPVTLSAEGTIPGFTAHSFVFSNVNPNTQAAILTLPIPTGFDFVMQAYYQLQTVDTLSVGKTSATANFGFAEDAAAVTKEQEGTGTFDPDVRWEQIDDEAATPQANTAAQRWVYLELPAVRTDGTNLMDFIITGYLKPT